MHVSHRALSVRQALRCRQALWSTCSSTVLISCADNIWTKRLLTEWANLPLLNQRAAPVRSDDQVYFREPDLT